MSKKKWVRPSETETSVAANAALSELISVKPRPASEIKEVKRNKMFDFAGDLSLNKTPIVATQIFNHTERSAIFTVTFTDLTEQEMETLIEIGNEV